MVAFQIIGAIFMVLFVAAAMIARQHAAAPGRWTLKFSSNMPAFAKASARQASSPVFFVGQEAPPDTPLFAIRASTFSLPPIKRGRAERRGHNSPAALRMIAAIFSHGIVTTKLPDPRAPRAVFVRFASLEPPVDLPFQATTQPLLSIGGLPIHRFGVRNRLTFKPRPVVSPPIDGPRDARRCAGTKRLGPAGSGVCVASPTPRPATAPRPNVY